MQIERLLTTNSELTRYIYFKLLYFNFTKLKYMFSHIFLFKITNDNTK